MRRILFVLVIFWVYLMGWTRVAEACSCIISPPACEAYWQADAIFLGRVISTAAMPQTGQPAGQLLADLGRQVRVLFEVKEVFRGLSESRIEVWTGRGGGDCGFSFNVGFEYLIYAHRQPGTSELRTSICTRTRALEQAAEDLAYARSVAISQATGGRIFGKVEHVDPAAPGLPLSARPVAGIKAILQRGDQRWETKTLGTGEYEFDGLQPGTYEVRFEPEAGSYLDGASRKVQLLDIRGCGCANVSLHSDGHVTGKVVTRQKKSIAGLTVELVYPEQLNNHFVDARYQAQTDENGRFEFVGVPPGRFLLGIHTNRDYRGALPYPQVFYPGVMDSRQAEEIELTVGQHLSLNDFVLPPSVRFVTITGAVIDRDGTPAKGAQVYLTDGSDPPRYIGKPAMTDAGGRFTLAAMEGFRFCLYSEIARPRPAGNASSEKIMVLAIPNLEPVRLHLK